MSALGLGQLMQHGLVQGAGLYTQGAELSMAREQQQQREAVIMQQLAERKAQAQQYLRQQEATRNVMVALMAPTAEGQDPWAGVNAQDLADADPNLQRVFSEGLRDKADFQVKRQRALIQRDTLRRNFPGMMVPERIKNEWASVGVDIGPNEDQDEIERQAMIHDMVLEYPQGQDGPPIYDAANEQRLNGMPKPYIERVYKEWLVAKHAKETEARKQAQLANQQAAMQGAYQTMADRNAPPEARAAAQATLAALNAPLGAGGKPEMSPEAFDQEVQAYMRRHPQADRQRAEDYVRSRERGLVNQDRDTIEGRVDPQSRERFSAALELATRDRQAAEKAYKAEYGLEVPPTDEALAKAGIVQDPSGLFNKKSDAKWAAVKEQVNTAWKRVEEARAAERRLLEQRASGAGQATPPRPSGSASAALPTPAAGQDVDRVIDELVRKGLTDDEIEAALRKQGIQ